MLHLATFGGLALRADDRPLGAAVAQRRPLAVLAVAAAAGTAGASRDRLLALLWPDAAPDRARRALAQALYALRRDTGTTDLLVGTLDLRLNPAVVDADTLAFDAAVRAGRPADAVACYRGPFLDGFTLPGGEEFERWADQERRRWARRVADLLRDLARAARAADARDEDVAWSRRLVEHDPVDGASVVALVEALGRVGDAPGARRAVREHAARLRDELGMAPNAAVMAALARVEGATRGDPAPTVTASIGTAPSGTARSATAPTPPLSPAAPRARGDAVATGVDASPPLDVVAPPASRPPVPHDGAPRPSPPLPGRRTIAALLVVATATIVTVRVAAPPPVASPDPTTPTGGIAVPPFAVTVAEPTLAFLGAGLADLVGRHLVGTGAVRVVAPERVADAWATPARDTGLAAWRLRALATGRRVGAAEVLVGHVAGSRDRLVVTIGAVDVASGRERATVTLAAPADSLASLADALAARVVVGGAIGDDDDAGDALATAPLRVLAPWLRGEAARRDDRFREAMAAYATALERDSTFAPAALGLALVADRLNVGEQHDRALAIAWTTRHRLGTRDRAFLVALAGPRFPAPSPVAEQVAAWEHALALAPERAEAWTALGERFLVAGALLGLREPHARAATAFRRALALDPGDARARRRLLEIAVRRGDTAPATVAALAPPAGDPWGDYLRWRLAIARGDTAAPAALRRRLDAVPDASLRAIALATLHDGLAPADADRALRTLAARASLGDEALDVLLATHALALARGQPGRARALTDTLHDALPGTRAHLRLRVLDALHGDGDVAAGVAAAELLAATADAPLRDAPGERATQLADACVLAQWRVAPWSPGRVPQTARVRDAVRRLRAAGVQAVTIPLGAAPRFCAALVDAMDAVAHVAPDARARLRALDELLLAGPALGDASAWAALALARLHAATGDTVRALAAVRRRPDLHGWPRYVVTALDLEARFASVLGDADAAAAAGRRRRALRDAPEPGGAGGITDTRPAASRSTPARHDAADR